MFVVIMIVPLKMEGTHRWTDVKETRPLPFRPVLTQVPKMVA